MSIPPFVKVRFFPPGIDPVVMTFDMRLPSDVETWKLNERLYPCAVIGWVLSKEQDIE